jgi:UDP-N-acetylmuramate dehydrogenase
MKKEQGFNLTNFNSYKIKAFCNIAYFPASTDEIVEIYNTHKHGEIIILGNGNNVILSKSSYDDSFIIFNSNFNKIEVIENEIITEAGATTLQLSETALKNSFTGAEIFYDIPSSIGGAIVMNAGASGEEIKDILVKVRYLDLADMEIKEIHTNEMGYEYRNSFFQKNTDKIVLKAWFRLKPGNPETIKDKMESIKKQRWAKQPREYPNCGSVFKRPKGYYVGAMIEELGLKGFTIGGAQISEKHGGFIVNKGNATGQNILAIIKVVQEKVKAKFGVDLEIEQRII